MKSVKEGFLKDIEMNLLPKECTFSDQQAAILEYEGSANIVAGPGSGKTTILIAKYATLLKSRVSSKKGICLITHTNVAVDEIKNGLVKLGFEHIDYPNFIGTIQEFFNYFFSRKAFHLIFGEKKIRILEEEDYRERFNWYFERLKPDNYNYNFPNPKNNNPKINIDGNFQVSITSEAKPFYRDAFNKSVEVLLKQGIVTNQQCLELADWYINKYSAKIQSAFNNRFEYLLLDEAQDTNIQQYNLLNKITNENINFQKYGDPYQGLYSIFGNEQDAWLPDKETTIPRLDIPETSRFSENIAKYVRNVCMEKYEGFQSISENNSFKPYFLVYKDGADLIEKYRNFIQMLEQTNEEFRKAKNKDALLSVKHDDLTSLIGSYNRNKSNLNKNQNVINQLYSSLLKIIAKELKYSKQEVEEIIQSDFNIKKNLAREIKNILVNRTEDSFLKIIGIIEGIIGSKLLEEKVTLIKLNLFDQANRLENLDGEEDALREINIGTVHSVKGETHRSTMLILNSTLGDLQKTYEFPIAELLKPYLQCNHIDLKDINDSQKRNETKNALKLAYVAFSRPTHLLSIAINEQNITKELRESLIANDWTEM